MIAFSFKCVALVYYVLDINSIQALKPNQIDFTYK